MRKILMLAAAGIASLWAGAVAAQVKWDLPAGYAAQNFHSQNLVTFANDVRTATGGKLDITVHPGASLFKVPEIKRAVQTGQAQIGELLMSNVENEDPAFGVDTVPFLATSYADAVKLWQASRPLLEKKMEAQGMMILFAVPWPPQGIYAKKELNSAADMKGVKFRAYNPATSRIAELVGAQPVTIQAADLPQALATGVVNSMITSGATGYDSKVWESLSHFYDTQAWLPKNMVFVNLAAFRKLDDASQKALSDAARIAEERGAKMSQEATGFYLKELVAKGMKVQPPGAAFKADLQKIGETLTAEWIKRAGADGQSIVDAYKKM